MYAPIEVPSLPCHRVLIMKAVVRDSKMAPLSGKSKASLQHNQTTLHAHLCSDLPSASAQDTIQDTQQGYTLMGDI